MAEPDLWDEILKKCKREMDKELKEKNEKKKKELIKLIKSGDWTVRYKIAIDPETPSEIRELLSHDEDLAVRKAVQRNLNTSDKTLEIMKSDDNPITKNLKMYPDTSKKTLEEIIGVDNPIKKYVRLNPDTLEKTLEEILGIKYYSPKDHYEFKKKLNKDLRNDLKLLRKKGKGE